MLSRVDVLQGDGNFPLLLPYTGNTEFHGLGVVQICRYSSSIKPSQTKIAIFAVSPEHADVLFAGVLFQDDVFVVELPEKGEYCLTVYEYSIILMLKSINQHLT